MRITKEIAAESIQRKAAAYDPTGDEHYDAISAMIKSVRGCDPDAALYWIARMLESGEDPRYIARRLAIFPQARRLSCGAPKAQGSARIGRLPVFLADPLRVCPLGKGELG